MSDGSIKITGDLKFIGYKQKANPGVNQQVLTYLNGEAVWSDRPGAINIVTSPVSNTVMTDNAGNVYTFDNETYPELRTTPIQEVESTSSESGTVGTGSDGELNGGRRSTGTSFISGGRRT